MPPIAQTDPDFVFRPKPPLESPVHFPFPKPFPPHPRPPLPNPRPSPLGPLEALAGTWTGTGFNTIWRPHFPDTPQDRFLELNPTAETLAFSPIQGAVPNRGLLQQDINMFGLTYLQQIADSSDGAGLHIEPGIWAVVPSTTDTAETETVVRLASIPHGTVILAQGTVSTTDGPPAIPDNNIIPFPTNGSPPPNSDFPSAERTFTELDLSVPSGFREPREANPQITQAMVVNPNSLLQAAIANQRVVATTTLDVSTTDTPVPGGGTANTAFLQAGNANAAMVRATFWIETMEEGPPGRQTLQLQYSQT
ncbi:MAG: heme-binding protein, partial [Acidimicrobiales bacterium]